MAPATAPTAACLPTSPQSTRWMLVPAATWVTTLLMAPAAAPTAACLPTAPQSTLWMLLPGARRRVLPGGELPLVVVAQLRTDGAGAGAGGAAGRRPAGHVAGRIIGRRPGGPDGGGAVQRGAAVGIGAPRVS
jgi:hypothetical protein